MLGDRKYIGNKVVKEFYLVTFWSANQSHHSTPKGPFTLSVRVSLRQRYDDACDTVLIGHNGVTLEWGCNPFWSDFIVVSENCVTSIIAALTQTDSNA